MQLSTLKPSYNLASRMGRWSAAHRKVAIFGWLAFVLAAIVIGTNVGQKTIDPHNSNVGQAHRADQIVKHGGFSQVMHRRLQASKGRQQNSGKAIAELRRQ